MIISTIPYTHTHTHTHATPVAEDGRTPRTQRGSVTIVSTPNQKEKEVGVLFLFVFVFVVCFPLFIYVVLHLRSFKTQQKWNHNNKWNRNFNVIESVKTDKTEKSLRNGKPVSQYRPCATVIQFLFYFLVLVIFIFSDHSQCRSMIYLFVLYAILRNYTTRVLAGHGVWACSLLWLCMLVLWALSH